MIDPFTAWSRMMSAGLDMQSTWLRGVETMQASGSVIGARTDMMRSVPQAGDMTEYARMVPEKVEAFSRSAQTVMRDTMTMQSAWATQMQRVGMMMLAGRVPTFAEATRLATQSADYAVGAMTAGARLGKGALAPVHRTATGNARRLKRTKSR
jgi:ABC-type taurine transport system substrate-binding protein